jgi:hypothetical protein
VFTRAGNRLELISSFEKELHMASKLLPTKAELAAVRARGRTGADGRRDSVLALLNPMEARLLLQRGGIGSALPGTHGMVHQFRVGGSMGAGADGGDSNDRTGQDAADHAGGGGGTHGGGGLTRDQIDAMVTGRPIAQGPSTGPAPTIQRSDGITGPRPGTGDRWGTTIGQKPAIQAAQDAYNAAADALANRSFGQWAGDTALDMVPGFHVIAPNWQHPETYQDGTYHTGWSPLAAAAGLAASAAPAPMTGTLVSRAAIAATNALGLPDYNFGSGTWHNTAVSPINAAMGPTSPSQDQQGSSPSGSSAGRNGKGSGSADNANLVQNNAGRLLPPIAGQGIATPPASGSTLPPTVAPVLMPKQLQPGGYQAVPGPTPYGWMLPAWRY